MRTYDEIDEASFYFSTLHGRYFAAYQRDDGSNTNVARARWVYEREIGQIPPGYHVHHVDGDRKNDTPGNLQALTPEAHAAIHRIDRTRTCAKCGKTFQAKNAHRKGRRFCGRECGHHAALDGTKRKSAERLARGVELVRGGLTINQARKKAGCGYARLVAKCRDLGIP